MLHEDFKDRALAEFEAESVAYIVCAAFSIDSGDDSFGYVTSWGGGGDEAIAAIRAAGSRIQRTADDIINRIENGGEAAKAASVTCSRAIRGAFYQPLRASLVEIARS
jgi:hypothetical protein